MSQKELIKVKSLNKVKSKLKGNSKVFLNLGCFVHGLYLEGAGWDSKRSCLVKQNPKELIKVIPIESHKLKLQVYI